MIDQQLYKDIGQLLYNESPDVSQGVSMSACVGNGWIDIAVWMGKHRNRESNISISDKGIGLMRQYLLELHDFYIDNDLGKWNLAHYVLAPEGESFSVDFEFNEEIENGKLTLYRYRKKFQSSS